MSYMYYAAVLICPFTCPRICATEYFVAPTGCDRNPGTLARPFASLERAQKAVQPGDTVWLRGGVYVYSSDDTPVGIVFNKSGSEENRVNYFAYPDERPIFDFQHLAAAAPIRGFSIRADWLHFRGIELRAIQQTITGAGESDAIRVEGGSSNVFESLDLHHNEGTGLFIASGADNLVLNCDSHHNYDPEEAGENADGFGVHSSDSGNIIRGCRSWFNSDDGYDLINCPGAVTIEHCWAWSNGLVPDTDQRAGNGAGIKAGGFLRDPKKFPAEIPRHIVRFNLSFNNAVQGFYANLHPGTLVFYNNTAFNNPRNFDMQTIVNPVVHILRNNLSYGRGEHIYNIVDSTPDETVNSWNLDVKISGEDFLTLSPDGVDGPRQKNGDLPDIGFMRLAPSSDLIDTGTDVGLRFNGAAPDLGAFEAK